MKRPTRVLKNCRGQGLIEYLIIVAIVAVGSIAVMRTVGANINVQFAKVSQALGGKSASGIEHHEVTKTMHSKKDLGSFFDGAVNKK